VRDSYLTVMSDTRKAHWLNAFAFGLALALLAPWQAVGAAPLDTSISARSGVGHHSGCPLVAARVQPALAPAAKAPAVPQPETAADRPWRAEEHFAPELPARNGPAAAPPPSSRPLYLLSSRLRL